MPPGRPNIGRYLAQVRRNQQYLRDQNLQIDRAQVNWDRATQRNRRDIQQTRDGLVKLRQYEIQEGDTSGIDRQIDGQRAQIDDNERQLLKHGNKNRGQLKKAIGDAHTMLALKRWAYRNNISRFNEDIRRDIYDVHHEGNKFAIAALQKAWSNFAKAVNPNLHLGRTQRRSGEIYIRPERFSAEYPDFKDVREAQKQIDKLKGELAKLDREILTKRLKLIRARSELNMKGMNARDEAYQRASQRRKQIRQWEAQLRQLQDQRAGLARRKRAIENAKRRLAEQQRQVRGQRNRIYGAMRRGGGRRPSAGGF